MNELEQLRERIDGIDAQILKLMAERMDVAAEIAAYKKERAMPVYQPLREQEKLAVIAAQSREDLKSSMTALYELIFELSRNHQNRLLASGSDTSGRGFR